MGRPLVSIVVVSYNVSEVLAGCLQSLREAAPTVPYEVIVVDNASGDGSVAMVRERFPECRLLANTCNRGFAAASNQGIAACDSPYVLLLNPDTRVAAGVIDALCRTMAAEPLLGLLGPLIVNPDGTAQSGALRFPTVGSLLWGTRGLRGVPAAQCRGLLPADWVLGACMLARREFILGVGQLDEGYFLYGEEKDWCFRAHQGGWQVAVLPEAQIVHLGGASTGQNAPRSYETFVDSQVRFFSKFYPPSCRRLFLLVTSLQAGAKGLAAGALALLLFRRREDWRRRARTYLAGSRRAAQYLLGYRRIATDV